MIQELEYKQIIILQCNGAFDSSSFPVFDLSIAPQFALSQDKPTGHRRRRSNAQKQSLMHSSLVFSAHLCTTCFYSLLTIGLFSLNSSRNLRLSWEEEFNSSKRMADHSFPIRQWFSISHHHDELQVDLLLQNNTKILKSKSNKWNQVLQTTSREVWPNKYWNLNKFKFKN